MTAPRLEGDALAAVRHRGGHLQIIASAGSGKTEVVSQRVADLLAEGAPSESIVAFTFTERAAAELRERIAERAEQRIGPAVLDHMGGLFVGTIHAYCFQLLRTYKPHYETYDVLDDHQLTAFLAREARRLDLKVLDPQRRLFQSIQLFLRGVDVIENELLDPAAMPDPFGSVLQNYLESLERYRLLTYGQQIVRAVQELQSPEVRDLVHHGLRHLIVDEYQDINPAQEQLIDLLVGPEVELCVVGDDDQAIYQWRGSDVSNIVTFVERYPDVSTFEISTNRRSRPTIVETANRFAATIPHRLDKEMAPHRSAGGGAEVVVWTADDEEGEAGWIANLIIDITESGVPYRDIAVLVRGQVAYRRLVETFATFDIPVQPAGRTGLFEQREALVIGRTFAWLTDIDWRSLRGPGAPVDEEDLLDDYSAVFGLDSPARNPLRRFLREWRDAVPRKDRTADLVGELYELLAELRVSEWELSTLNVNRLGTLARFSALLADYESVRRRARPDPTAPGEQVGGEDRGDWYYRNLAIHIVNYAQGAYEGFDGEPNIDLDAIDLTTVHRAKGLEWPVVFVPSMTASRFPSSRTGETQDWLVPREMFAASRYEGSDADERRLFYVALTRARDWASISRHEKVTSRRTASSPYYDDLRHHEVVAPAFVQVPDVESVSRSEGAVELTYSELSLFLDCGMAYRLRTLLGFQPRLAPELGYGKAVHHVLRTIADATRATGRIPTPDDIKALLDGSFFLPTANKPAHRQLKDAARRLVLEYIRSHPDDLFRVWETERPFELHLDSITVTGRADVILDHEGGVPTALAILDYKTSTKPTDIHDLQLQVYADAGRREGLDVRGAYVHDLKAGCRAAVDVGEPAVAEAEVTVRAAAERLRDRDYTPSPGRQCRRCEVRTVCGAAAV